MIFPTNCINILNLHFNQVKSQLIRQQEVNQLVPAAGPDASDVLHLLRPLAALDTPSSSACMLQPGKVAAQSRAQTIPGERGIVETLLGMSCAIASGGEVC